VRLHEKGGKLHEMHCHHTLQGYLAEYVERARLAEAGRAALYQAIKCGRWRHMPPPAPRSSTAAVRTASRSTRL
jgi:integrase/recombinase XerD